jgi:diketogulonate reductase-like aldo/keto reductase
VSNFGVAQIEEMKAYATVWPPHVNQIEVSSVPVNSSFWKLLQKKQRARGKRGEEEASFSRKDSVLTKGQLHPWSQQKEVVQYCQKHKMVVEAHCPLLRDDKANDPTLRGLAKKYNKTTAQILIRYSLQKGWVTLPTTDNSEQIVQSVDVFGFDISKEDMATLDGLDQGSSGPVTEAVESK